MTKHDLSRHGLLTRATYLLALVLAAVALPGCPKLPEGVPEILPRDALIARYNLRAKSIGMLRAKCHLEARLTKLDDQGKPIKDKVDTYSLDGNLLLRKPRDLYLVGKAFSDEMFGLHSNAERYWWWVKPGEPVEYVGRHGGPGADLFPVRPDLLIEALAIYPLPEDMRIFKRGDQFDVIQTQGVELEPSGGEAAPVGQVKVLPYLVQEISLERVHHDPVEVRIYRQDGEPLLIARLENYQEVASRIEGDKQTETQRVPMKIVYRFVPIDWTFTLDLSEVSLTREIKPAVFEYRTKGFDRTIDLDAEAVLRGTKPKK